MDETVTRNYPRSEGQIDLFEMLGMIEQEGLVPQSPDLPEHERRERDERVRSKMEPAAMGPNDYLIEQGEGYSFWVTSKDGERLHSDPFWSQVECWAFIVGYRSCDNRRRF